LPLILKGSALDPSGFLKIINKSKTNRNQTTEEKKKHGRYVESIHSPPVRRKTTFT
jgi:hypothetical protein